MSDQVKRKRKQRSQADEDGIYFEIPPHWTEKFLPPPFDAGMAALAFGTSLNPLPGHIADLRSKIEADTQLTKDLDFFVQETGWSREEFLWRLFWDADVMHRRIKAESRPLAPAFVNSLLNNIRKTKEGIERVNATDFSPARAILYDRNGQRLPPEREQAVVRCFEFLPQLLTCYREVVDRNLREATENSPQSKKSQRLLIDLVKRDSVYQRILEKAGMLHSTRLHRLVNAARITRGLPPIELHALLKWLSQFNKARRRAKAAART